MTQAPTVPSIPHAIILTAATAHNGDQFAIIRRTDGSYGVTRNHHLVHHCGCGDDGLEQCAKMLIRFAVSGTI
jgi:hypothetical protein